MKAIAESVEQMEAVRVVIAGRQNVFVRVGEQWYEDLGTALHIADRQGCVLEALCEEWLEKEGGARP